MVAKSSMNLLVAMIAMASSSVYASTGSLEFFGNGACQSAGQGEGFQIGQNSATGCIALVGENKSALYSLGGNCAVSFYSDNSCKTLINGIDNGGDEETEGKLPSVIFFPFF